jgi:surfactin synthase thioesterase subunit
MPTEQELTAVLALHGMDVLSEESADAEARVYAMDLLRSDMRLTTAYAGPRATAPCPVGALCGKDDPLCPTRDGTFEWESWSGGNFAAREVEGKHLDLLSPHRAKEFWEIITWLGMRGVGCDVGRPAGDRKT